MTQYQHHTPPKLHNHGFTLVELMVTIAVMGIIATMAAPSMSRALANQRVKSTTTIIENALTQARIESAIRKKQITVTLSGTATGSGNTLKDNTIKVLDGSKELSNYKLNSRSLITPSIAPTSSEVEITFLPSSKINSTAAVTYTICDSSSIDETPLQLVANTIGKISIKQAGTCP